MRDSTMSLWVSGVLHQDLLACCGHLVEERMQQEERLLLEERQLQEGRKLRAETQSLLLAQPAEREETQAEPEVERPHRHQRRSQPP